jgi:hypothetical protein
MLCLFDFRSQSFIAILILWISDSYISMHARPAIIEACAKSVLERVRFGLASFIAPED